MRLLAGSLTAQTLVREVGKVDNAVGNGKGTAAVFVDPGTHVVRGRGNVGYPSL
jgi:hypothetical protein